MQKNDICSDHFYFSIIFVHWKREKHSGVVRNFSLITNILLVQIGIGIIDSRAITQQIVLLWFFQSLTTRFSIVVIAYKGIASMFLTCIESGSFFPRNLFAVILSLCHIFPWHPKTIRGKILVNLWIELSLPWVFLSFFIYRLSR